MKTYTLALVILMGILVLGVLYSEGIILQEEKTSTPKPSTPYNSAPRNSNPSPAPAPVIITASAEDYEKFERIMPQTDLVQDIPKNGKIQLSFFNFNSGDREWERDYILTRGSIMQGTAGDIDIKLILHSRNLPKLNQNNLCDVFQNAKKKGDFGSELLISKSKFSWKYKWMMGYKSCLGF